MLTGSTSRRFAAVLTAVIAAMVVVAFGSAPSTAAPAPRVSVVGATHTASATASARSQVSSAQPAHHQTPLHLDLASTPPTSPPHLQELGHGDRDATAQTRAGRDFVPHVGRAPPG